MRRFKSRPTSAMSSARFRISSPIAFECWRSRSARPCIDSMRFLGGSAPGRQLADQETHGRGPDNARDRTLADEVRRGLDVALDFVSRVLNRFLDLKVPFHLLGQAAVAALRCAAALCRAVAILLLV